MTDFYARQRAYWNALADLDPDSSIIDPQDTRGLKNAYLAGMRDAAFAAALERHAIRAGTLLDFGCGTGSASVALLRAGHRVVGLDIALPLLKQARARCGNQGCVFVHTDGRSVPVAEASADASIIYGVLCYVPDDDHATALLREIRAAMSPGGPLLMIEQSRRRRTPSDEGLKVQRTLAQWQALMHKAGFRIERSTLLRHGRFPLTPLIRHGLVPRRLWPLAARTECAVAARTGIWRWDYADVLFEALA